MDLKKYNQRLLAIIGTLLIIGLVFTFLVTAISFFSSSLGLNRTKNSDDGIIIDQNQVIDTTAYSFVQEISLLNPYQLDSLEPVFIVPIGQKDQKSRRDKVAVAGFRSNSYSYSDNYNYSNFRGIFNNFILIDYLRELKAPIFESKVAITEWAYLKIDSTQLILFKGTTNDTNDDGRLNKEDFQSLFVYDIEKLKLKELSFKNQTVRNFEPLRKTTKIYVRTGKDVNEDLKFDSNSEPTDLYFYDVVRDLSEPLVPDSIKNEIQKILN